MLWSAESCHAMPWQRNMGQIFQEANISFKAAEAELNRKGKCDTEHYPAITSDDLVKLYSSVLLNQNTPIGLAKKVQFDIHLFFCRGGAENMHGMSKNTFKVTKINGRDAVVLSISEASKNHRDDKDAAFGGFMPSFPSSDLCPVKSFTKYLNCLHPGSQVFGKD